jgi:hypothetical protein
MSPQSKPTALSQAKVKKKIVSTKSCLKEPSQPDPSIKINNKHRLPDGYRGDRYHFIFTAIGGEAPYRWCTIGLPHGLRVEEHTGILSGVPYVSGTYDVTVMCYDHKDIFGLKQIKLVIYAPLCIINSSVIADAGKVFTEQIVVSGGKAPYTWSVPYGIPKGVGIDPVTGILSGIYCETGIHNVQIQVTDALNKSYIKHIKFSVQ